MHAVVGSFAAATGGNPVEEVFEDTGGTAEDAQDPNFAVES